MAEEQAKLSFLQRLYAQLAQLAGGDEAMASRVASKIKGGTADPDIAMGAFAEHPLKTKVPLGEGITGNSLSNTLSTIGAAAKANPWKAAGLGAMGVANIAGLADDDKIGGQLVGGLGGGIAANLLGASPMTALAIGLGGGTLGSLFDKLRAKKEAEQQAVYQQQTY